MLEYRFDGERKWTRSNDMNLRLPALQPNNYSLEVRGVFSNVENTNTRLFEFTILPPWWQTGWLGWRVCLLLIYLFLDMYQFEVEE
ncbi:MAG: hypothetical protein ACI86M_000478 [Saprospiraceae bacterium]|jgi:hypothetical protein